MDTDNNARIGVEDLLRVMRETGADVTEEEARDLILACNGGNENNLWVSLPQFRACMRTLYYDDSDSE